MVKSLNVRVLGIAVMILAGTGYSSYALWKGKREIKKRVASLSVPQSNENAILNSEQQRAYLFIIDLLEMFWRVSLNGVSVDVRLNEDLFFSRMPTQKKYAFIDAIEQEFGVELPDAYTLGSMTLKEVLNSCIVETELAQE